MPRFVILRHQPGPRSTRDLHWDLMFECGDTLRTFASLSEPHFGTPLAVQAIADHRLEYLNYEGPVSAERGQVSRWDLGEFDVLSESPTRWVIDARGQRWQGPVEFQSTGDQRWMVTPADAVTE